MKLSELLKAIDYSGEIADCEITALTHDSRIVTKGTVFFALRGSRTDGSKYIREAAEKGAVCIVADEDCKAVVPEGCQLILVQNTRLAMALLSKKFYGDTCDRMKIIAVVGTNGKTTSAHILNHILIASNIKTGVIGTLGVQIGDKDISSNMTTPDPIELHKYFAQMHEAGVTHVIMEASAHAIHFNKLGGLAFECAIFTNISQDHLDFFPTFENYCNTKIDFFLNSSSVKSAIVNIDSEFGKRITAQRTGGCISYSLEESADFQVEGVVLTAAGSNFALGSETFSINLPAKFNVYNAVACIAAARELEIPIENIKTALATLPLIPGRFNLHNVGGISVIIDYAHTPDGLEKLITAAREFCKGRIITVFGCGGNRDKEKRPLMGAVAVRLSDFVIITSDNPRGEKPRAIIKQIVSGIQEQVKGQKKGRARNYKKIPNRTKAIRYSLKIAASGDTVIIAGKGAESYMEIRGKKIEYSDTVVIKNCEATQNN